jgi:GH25 family lysozyme M1 (1,4-beta-N-acetylmuramidase)
MIFGIDTASVAGNKNPNWTKAKAEGPISFAIIRACYGTKPDTVFARDWPLLKSAALTRGAYLFLRFPRNGVAAPDPETQAQAFIDTVGPLDDDDFPPTLDVEFPGDGRVETGLSAVDCLAWVQASHGVLREHYGAPPIIYTSKRVWRDDLGDQPAPDLIDSPLWLARYFFRSGPAVRDASAFADGKLAPPVPAPWGDGNWWIHQYQGDATGFPGFASGNVDVNRFGPMIRGATGERVRWVQRRLRTPVTGKFDLATEKALRAFQSKQGLVVDGVIGPRTFVRLAWTKPVK